MLAVQDRRDDPAMLLLLDQGVFFEFVSAEEADADRPTRLRLHEVEADVPYAVVLNTDSGIFAYYVGDLVRFTSVRPFRMVFHGRMAHTLNAYGEHVSSGELDRAVAAAAGGRGAKVVEYSVAAVYPEDGRDTGGHVYYVEFAGDAPDLERFAKDIDAAIIAGNEDYETHRKFGVDDPVVEVVPKGGFYAWMESRGKIGGQNKVPRVLKPEQEAALRETVARLRRDG
jgi:hypothetical protein